ncbi:UvrD-helicase domain-containing protein [Pelagibius sp. CAU 1746]|uniref:UvrD-helicase domain-containing protein n=1 Tax=Pelagibius sp. CAU 1746 TaxID=3140370 RepID=UPI00325BD628
MTSRIGKPDTETDVALRDRLNSEGTRHFVMVAGAGSGKTTSLVKALAHLACSQGPRFRREGKQIACITYTEVAVEEIKGDVGGDNLFHISTIHSFLWTVIKPFQKNLRTWVLERLDRKIAEANEKIGNPRSRATTKAKAAEDIERYTRQKDEIKRVKTFRYGTGSDYSNGILGHSDILSIGPDFIRNSEIMRKVIARRFPVIFVDESQDTDPNFVEALRIIATDGYHDLCLGFFGDPVQKIYMQGAGPIATEEGWVTLRKPENFRCPQKVLAVINSIRAEDDRLEQTGGRVKEINGKNVFVQGTARVVILPADERRQERLENARSWLAEQDDDEDWCADEDAVEADIRLLVLVHRMAANRLGFPSIYSALNDKAPEDLKSGLVDGTAWVVRPFLSYILPLIAAQHSNSEFEVMRMLRRYCPCLQPEHLAGLDAAEILADLKDNIAELTQRFEPDGGHTIGDIFLFLKNNRLLALDERFDDLLKLYQEGQPPEQEAPENAAHRFALSPATELWGYRRYIEDLSPFATQQGIKGAEFEKVLLVIDDQEGVNPAFSYGKYFGVTELTAKDQDNIDQKKDSVIDRTRRLFYVCCSRALHDLAVVVFAEDVERMREAIQAKTFFQSDDIVTL